MKNALFIIRNTEISNTCDKRTQNSVDSCIDTSQKHAVIIKNTNCHQSNKSRDNQTVCIVDHDITKLVHEHSTDIFKDTLLRLLRRQ